MINLQSDEQESRNPLPLYVQVGVVLALLLDWPAARIRHWDPFLPRCQISFTAAEEEEEVVAARAKKR